MRDMGFPLFSTDVVVVVVVVVAASTIIKP
jgi:hypothetical protein